LCSGTEAGKKFAETKLIKCGLMHTKTSKVINVTEYNSFFKLTNYSLTFKINKEYSIFCQSFLTTHKLITQNQ
ncbi:MAG: hypothetical protein ACOWW1_03470, partial [archaeon]